VNLAAAATAGVLVRKLRRQDVTASRRARRLVSNMHQVATPSIT